MGDEHRGVQVPPELHAVPPRLVEVSSHNHSWVS